MNIILMVSRVTYVPNNYSQLIEECLHIPRCNVVGILMFENRNKTVLIQSLKLILAGAVRLGSTLMHNWFMSDPKIRIAQKNKIPVYRTANPNSENCLQWIRNLQPDLLLHLRTRCILKPELLQIPRFGAVNIHHGLLPETRGTMCDLRLLLRGRNGGFSLHQMIPAVDQGALFSKVEVANMADCDKNYQTYLKLSTQKEIQAARDFLEQVSKLKNLPQSLPQPNTQSFWYKTPTWTEIRTWRKEGWKL